RGQKTTAGRRGPTSTSPSPSPSFPPSPNDDDASPFLGNYVNHHQIILSFHFLFKIKNKKTKQNSIFFRARLHPPSSRRLGYSSETPTATQFVGQGSLWFSQMHLCRRCIYLLDIYERATAHDPCLIRR
ncbi:hypothetical protein NC651_001197, partial [Populus alba x Populus x berolinensis]